MDDGIIFRMNQIKSQSENLRCSLMQLYLDMGISFPLMSNTLQNFKQLKNMIDNFENGSLSLRRPLNEKDNTKDMNV